MEIQGRHRTSAQILKTQHGFALVLMLALMPLIMSAMIAYLLLNTTLQTWMNSMHICRTELLETQSQVGLDLEKLMQTNDAVRTVRTQILTTQLAIVAATAAYQFYAVPPLQKTLLFFQQEERALGVLQKGLIASATAKMNIGSMNAQRKIQAQYRDLAPKLIEFVSIKLLSSRSVMKRLAVKADRPSAPAAVYELENNFKQRQTLSVFWTTEMKIIESQWSNNWFRFKTQKSESCASTLEQEDKQWKSILNEDKPLLKY